MCVALVGGMDRLQRHYIDEAGKLGMKLQKIKYQEVGK